MLCHRAWLRYIASSARRRHTRLALIVADLALAHDTPVQVLLADCHLTPLVAVKAVGRYCVVTRRPSRRAWPDIHGHHWWSGRRDHQACSRWWCCGTSDDRCVLGSRCEGIFDCEKLQVLIVEESDDLGEKRCCRHTLAWLFFLASAALRSNVAWSSVSMSYSLWLLLTTTRS